MLHSYKSFTLFQSDHYNHPYLDDLMYLVLYKGITLGKRSSFKSNLLL